MQPISIKNICSFLVGGVLAGFGVGYIMIAYAITRHDPLAFVAPLSVGVLTLAFIWQHNRPMALGMTGSVIGLTVWQACNHFQFFN